MRLCSLVVAVILAGCGTAGGSDSGAPPEGCQLAQNWTCSGNADTCTASCDERFGVICQQGWTDGPCMVTTYGTNEGDACAIPTGTAECNMCLDAVITTCAAYVSP